MAPHVRIPRLRIPRGRDHRGADPRRDASQQVSQWPDHALVRARQLDPLGAERALVLVQPVHRLAFLRLVPRAGDIDAAEVHLGRMLADRQLDRPPAQEVERAGVRLASIRPVARERRREPAPVAVQHETGNRRAVLIGGLEQDRNRGAKARVVQSRNDAREPRAKCRRSPVWTGELVEPRERNVGRVGRRDEIGRVRLGARCRGVVPDDAQPALCLADPLTGRFRDVLERRFLVRAAAERDRQPVARRLDLLNRMEADAVEGLAVAARRDLGIGGNDVHAAVPEIVGHALEPCDRVLETVRGHRPPWQVRARATHQRPRPDEREHSRVVGADEVPRLPAAGRAVLGPLARLQHVAALGSDRPVVPGPELLGGRGAVLDHAAIIRRAGAGDREGCPPGSAAPAPAARARRRDTPLPGEGGERRLDKDPELAAQAFGI